MPVVIRIWHRMDELNVFMWILVTGSIPSVVHFQRSVQLWESLRMDCVIVVDARGPSRG